MPPLSLRSVGQVLSLPSHGHNAPVRAERGVPNLRGCRVGMVDAVEEGSNTTDGALHVGPRHVVLPGEPFLRSVVHFARDDVRGPVPHPSCHAATECNKARRCADLTSAVADRRQNASYAGSAGNQWRGRGPMRCIAAQVAGRRTSIVAASRRRTCSQRARRPLNRRLCAVRWTSFGWLRSH